MSDLKIIVMFVCIGVLFTGVLALLSSESENLQEYSAPTNYTEPSTSSFTSLATAINFDTGIWFIDNWIVSIFTAIAVFLTYRAIRGQG